jgi:large subunit ribosomal protein L19
MDLIKIAEEAFATGKQHPSFKAGDTVTVAYRITEGNKERVQLYRGVVIKISGHGEKKRFTVRKMSGTVGVERIFPIESPAIDSIEVNKVGKVRRAKLYYLRALTGKKLESKKKELSSKFRFNDLLFEIKKGNANAFLFLFDLFNFFHSQAKALAPRTAASESFNSETSNLVFSFENSQNICIQSFLNGFIM